MTMNPNSTLKPDIIPTLFWDNRIVTKENVIADILEQYHEAGLTKFVLNYPSIGWLPKGFPPIEVFQTGGEVFHQIKEAVAPYGIQIGWWFRTSVNSGPTPGFQRIVKPDGSMPPYSNCPLCANLRKRVAESVALFASLGKPDFIFFEDDFSIGAQTGGMGCFCEAHLAEFARREGRSYTREELVAILKQTTPDALALNRRWRELIKDSLAGFAAAIRTEVDKKTPEISIGHMQPGSSDQEGDSTEAVARAFAGPNHTPYTRFFSCFYGVESANALPETLFNPLYKIQHTGKNFLFYLEADAWPHKRFFRSASFMRAAMGAASSFGYDGATFNNTQFTDHQNEEKAYTRMMGKELPRFTAVYQLAKKCRLKGVALEYDPFFNSIYGNGPLWLSALAQFGIPFTTSEADIAFWDERQAQYMDDESILKALSKGLFLDGPAAKHLCDRGYGDYLGISVEEPISKKPFFKTFSSDTDSLPYSFGAGEVICEAFRSEDNGYRMGSPYGYCPSGVGELHKINVTDPKCEVLTEFYAFPNQFITAGMTRFQNRLGGRIVVLGCNLEQKYALVNYRRQRLIQDQLLWCADDVAFVQEAPSVYCIMNEATNPVESGFLGMLTLINLCEDALEEVTLHLPAKWCNAAALCTLEQDGTWRPLHYTLSGQTLTVKERLEYLAPMYLLIK